MSNDILPLAMVLMAIALAWVAMAGPHGQA
jgi:hypothetical protein